MKLTIDFETRSEVDIKRAGAWRYAEDPSTDILMLGVKADAHPAHIWFPPWVRALLPADHGLPVITDAQLDRALNMADVVEAHNAEFERAIWTHIMAPRYNFSMAPLDKLWCSASLAATHSLPRDLARVSIVLGLTEKKDPAGHRLMLKMCKPKPSYSGKVEWYERPEQIIALAKYCLQDVEAEHELSLRLRPLSPLEREVWLLDQKINRRGMYVDVKSARAIIATVQRYEKSMISKIHDLVPFSVKQRDAVLRWLLEEQGVDMPDLQRQTVIDVLESDIPLDARRVLEIRQALGRSSVSKYDAMLRMANKDSRIRGLMMYHGASTGRWAGRLLQPHNLPRGDFTDVEYAAELMVKGDIDGVEILYGDVMSTAATLIRSMLSAPPKRQLLAADFSAIEARAIAWEAGETKVLDVFNRGGDIYKAAAVDIFGGSEDAITKDQRQIGKVVILSCGYQGHIGAFQTMARAYGVKIEDERAAEIVNAWRRKNKAIVRFWHELEFAAMTAVKQPGALIQYRHVKFQVRGDFLVCRLPSGRFLWYPSPGTRVKKLPMSGQEKEVVTYWGVDSQTKQWMMLDTYGGKLAENITQAVCRDLLAEALLRLDAAGFDIVLHVHDEIVAEIPEDAPDDTLSRFCAIMAQTPSWAEGLPIKASGWRGQRYRKG